MRSPSTRPAQDANSGAVPKIVLGGAGSIAAAVTIWGLMHWNLPFRYLWPGHSLRSLGIVAAVFLLGCAIVWGFAPLRRRHRGIAVAIVLLVAVCGSGVGGVCAVLYFLASSLALGSMLCRRPLGDRPGDPWLDGFVCLTIGSILWALIVWVLVHFPINYPLLYVALLLFPLCIERQAIVDYGRLLIAGIADREQEGVSKQVFALGSLALGFVLLQLAVGMWPEVGFDGLSLHLRVPSFVACHHYFDFNVRENCLSLVPYFSYWPFTIVHQLGGEPAVKLLNAAFFLLVAAGAWRVVRRHADALWACLAVAILASTPLFLGASSTLFSENYLVLGTLALFVMLGEGGTPATGSETLRQDAALAVLMAFPLLIKVYGVLLTAAAVLVWGWQMLQKPDRLRSWRRLLCVPLAVVAVGGLPYVHAWVRTGNPVFPFYNHVFQSPDFPARDFTDHRWTGHLTPDILYRMVFDSPRYCECAEGALGYHFLILTSCALAGLMVTRTRVVGVAVLLTLVFGGGLLLKMQYLRYLLPVAPLIVVAALVALGQAFRQSIRLRTTAIVALAALCGFNLLAIPSGYPSLVGLPLRTAFDARARQEFIVRFCPVRQFVAQINQTHGAASRVAILKQVVGLTELQGTPFYGAPYNQEFLADLGRLTTRDAILDWIEKWRPTHVIWGPCESALLNDVLGSVAQSRQESGGVTLAVIDADAIGSQRNMATAASPQDRAGETLK